MQSDLMPTGSEISYADLRNQPGSFYEVKVVTVITGGTHTYYDYEIRNCRITQMLYGDSVNPVGGTASAQCDFTVQEYSENWPRTAKFTVYTRLSSKDESVKSNWFPLGVFYTDERTENRQGSLYVVGYDAMLKGEQDYWTPTVTEFSETATYAVGAYVMYDDLYKCTTAVSTPGNWTGSDNWALASETWSESTYTAALNCASKMGVSLETDTDTFLRTNAADEKYTIGPAGYPGVEEGAFTVREVLAYIGTAFCGNWVITADEKLKLIRLADATARDETLYLIDEFGNHLIFEDPNGDASAQGETGKTYYHVLVPILQSAPDHTHYILSDKAGDVLTFTNSARVALETGTMNVGCIYYATGLTPGVTTNEELHTDYIDISDYEKIAYGRTYVTWSEPRSEGIAFYDENKSFISGSGIAGVGGASEMHYEEYVVEIPEGAKYVRCTALNPSVYEGVGDFTISGIEAETSVHLLIRNDNY